MKRNIFFLLLGSFLISGCLVRTYTVEKPRTDLKVSGNQGYLVGQPKQKRNPPPKTRKYTVIEIELGKSKKAQAEETVVEDRTSVAEAPAQNSEEAVFEEETPKEKSVPEDAPLPKPNLEEKPKYQVYTVRKNDTLQKISKRFYGTTRRWKKIYRVNRDILKSPDKVYPGQVLKIPE